MLKAPGTDKKSGTQNRAVVIVPAPIAFLAFDKDAVLGIFMFGNLLTPLFKVGKTELSLTII